MIVRLAKRGEATCCTAKWKQTDAVGYGGAELVHCGEPAAVMAKAFRDCEWEGFCRKHWGPVETDELRKAAEAAGGK